MIEASKIGPVEMLAVSFPGSQFKGEILPALRDLVDNELIRVIDLVVVTKDEEGVVRALEVDDLDDATREAMQPFARGLDPDGLLGQDDLDLAAQELDRGSTAALLVWEDRWAAPITSAIRNAGGVVLAHERVPREAVEEVIAAVNANERGDGDGERGYR